jgi:pimeloyl-ACP methyl ester carboxylesterase
MTAYPHMPEPRFVQTNGIKMAVFEAGPTDGLPVVLAHGFPELSYSWRDQIPALASEGYRVIAPDLRGYGLTDKPQSVEAYDIHHLVDDVIGLLDAMNIEQAIFAGHDWGGLITWTIPLKYPERVAGMIGLCTPFIPRYSADPIKLMEAAFGSDFYIVRFQSRDTDAILNADAGRTLRFFMRKVPISAEKYLKLPKHRQTAGLLSQLETPESEWSAPLAIAQANYDVFAETFSRTGFSGGMNWYRNMTRNWETTADLPARVLAPSFMLTASNDIFLPPAFAVGMDKYVSDLETHLVEDCGHWIQQEKPQEVNRLMLRWLKKRFG